MKKNIRITAAALAALLFLSGETAVLAAEEAGQTLPDIPVKEAGQTPPDIPTEESGQLPSGIACSKLEERINEYIAVRRDTTSSVSVTCFNETEDIARVIYGDANTAQGIRADEETIYEWGSISKMLIWTSVMQLYEQGKLDLNEDVRSYLPEGFLGGVSADDPVTMIHLMNHTAGFQETTWDVEVLDPEDIISLKDALLATQPPQIYKTGTTVAYSNWGAALAAYIVECISGMDYADYVSQNIFEPLGMERTSLRPDCSDNEWVAERRDRTNAYYNVQGAYEDYGACRHYILLYPAGAATGTMSDLVRFAKAFLAESGNCPLFAKPDTLTQMLSPTLYYDGTDTPRICSGLFSQEYGVRLIGHAGNTAGFTANLVLDRESGTGLVVMTNEVGETTYNYGLVSLVFGDRDAEAGFAQDDLSGIYCNTMAKYSRSFLKLCSIISGLLPITKGESEGSYQVAMVGSITQVSENACIMDDGNGMKDYLSIQRDENGDITALQHSSGRDFQKVNPMFFAGKLALFLLFISASFWTLIMLVVHGIMLRRFRGTILWKKKCAQLLSELLAVLAFAAICWLMLPALMGGSLVKAQVTVKCVLISLFTLGEAVTLLSGLRGTHKIGFTVTKLSGLLLIANVLYWHFYQFWGC